METPPHEPIDKFLHSPHARDPGADHGDLAVYERWTDIYLEATAFAHKYETAPPPCGVERSGSGSRCTGAVDGDFAAFAAGYGANVGADVAVREEPHIDGVKLSRQLHASGAGVYSDHSRSAEGPANRPTANPTGPRPLTKTRSRPSTDARQ